MEPAVDSITTTIMQYGYLLVPGVLILAIGLWSASWVARLIRRGLQAAHVNPTMAGFLGRLSYVIIIALVIVSALQKLGVPTASFYAVLGAAGLAVGLALKGTLSNLASGVLLIALGTFKVGDRIESAGASGTVEEVGVFTTTLVGADDTRIIIPNAAVTGGNIVRMAGGV